MMSVICASIKASILLACQRTVGIGILFLSMFADCAMTHTLILPVVARPNQIHQAHRYQ